MSRRLTYEDVKKFVEVESNSGCKLLSKKYINIDKKILFKCRCGKEFTTTLSSFKWRNKRHCYTCGSEIRSKQRRLSIDELEKMIDGFQCKYISGEYSNFNSELTLECRCGNHFITKLISLRNSSDNIGKCENCVAETMREHFAHSFKFIESFFKEKECSLLSKEYINANSKLKYIASCGHTDYTSFAVFKKRVYHNCSECSKKESTSGNKNYNWKGGTYSSEREKFRKTFVFKEWVKGVYKRDGYVCQLCGRGGSINSHHLDGYNWCVEKRTDVNNGVTLCEGCHKDFHMKYGYGDNTEEQFLEYIAL